MQSKICPLVKQQSLIRCQLEYLQAPHRDREGPFWTGNFCKVTLDVGHFLERMIQADPVDLNALLHTRTYVCIGCTGIPKDTALVGCREQCQRQ